VVTLAADDREPDRATASSDSEAAHRRARSGAALPWTALAAAALCVGLLVEVRAAPVRVPMVLASMACLVVAAPLAAAWKSPVVATIGAWAAAAVFAVVVTPLTGMLSPIGLVVLTPFFVAALADRRQSCIGLTVCCLGLVAAFGLSAFPRDLPLLLLAWGAGRVLGERTRLVGQLEATSALLVEQRATALRQAVLDERARVAGDLHDAVGHRLTVLALHAAAVRRMWNSDHGRAEAALATIAEVAEAALAELRQGLVNPEAEGSRAFPLSAVRALVNGARAAGLPVDIRTVDTARELVAVHPAAYRLLQEALTNVLRHAPGAAVRVTLRCSAGRLTVSVENTPGADPTRKGAGGGSGLTGMRRRVESCGGRLTWGCRPDGGFAVHADLPSATVPS
jgi:signal transduction histidine kinase